MHRKTRPDTYKFFELVINGGAAELDTDLFSYIFPGNQIFFRKLMPRDMFDGIDLIIHIYSFFHKRQKSTEIYLIFIRDSCSDILDKLFSVIVYSLFDKRRIVASVDLCNEVTDENGGFGVVDFF